MPLDLDKQSRAWRAAVVFALLLTLMSMIQGHHRAKKGRNALLKWAPVQEAVDQGEEIYGVGAEGYPTLPLSLLVMRPFHVAGKRLGPALWAAFKLGLAWWMVASALGLAFGSARAAPGWALWLVLLGSFRVLHSDIQHGNLNLLVGACVTAGIVALARGREWSAGAAFGVGAVLKVTPALGLIWLLTRRSWRGTLGFGLGVLGGILAPSSWLGLGRTLSMTRAWAEQMLLPYLGGRELTLLQTEHINQSLLGVMARHLTDAVAIPARPRGPLEAMRIGWLDLGPETFRWVHMGVCMALLCLFVWVAWTRGKGQDSPYRVLGTGALLGLTMLLLSERSWKHHHVLLPLAVAFLARAATIRHTRSLATVCLAVALLAFAGTGDALLGSWGSDLAEAYGAYCLGDLVLFLGLGRLLLDTDLSAIPPHAET
ncbi:MAG: alpha-1,2-mannosyltransferase [Planctomycetota bacterium]|jgi:alpha-1,2-mannosyltransferase